MSYKLAIVDFKNIISTIQEVYNLDYSDYALTAFKRRLERLIQENNLFSADKLIDKIKEDKNFFEIFLRDISVEETEMFRDPEFWSYLKDTILPDFKNELSLKIWLPDSTSGEELFTLAIVLRELSMENRAKIIVTNQSRYCTDFISAGQYDLKKMEINDANYARYKGESGLGNYYTIVDNKVQMDISLLGNVEFINQPLLNSKPPSGIKIIIYRNKMIYFNLQLQNKILCYLLDSLLPGGIFVIGVKESIENSGCENKFIPINAGEGTYKKVLI